MHSCWKTVNIAMELGLGRVYLLSSLLGILSFIFLFIPYSLIHQNIQIVEHGFLTVMIILITLPTFHNLSHVIPLILLNKKIKGKFRFELGFWPIFSFRPMMMLPKGICIMSWLSPTLFLTVPGLIGAVMLPSLYPYFLLFTAINIGISYKDFVYVHHFIKAPHKSIIENRKDGFDILVKK
ncbi:DUF3267 domain-containing protein [Salirhabdus sp. Marseille-P4669]|uniref:DUF3267 domain-containing protein n=1 Tax=Salirhabdus sp. Marseille-P4669 TaxID=2042310 RepID=UPI000C7D7284|nr:DUF3267 domain-containing protein [Salirhabdus sp. Marseille-P4669]